MKSRAKTKKVKVNGGVYIVSEYKAEAIQTAKDFYGKTKYINVIINMIMESKTDNEASRALMTAHERYLALC